MRSVIVLVMLTGVCFNILADTKLGPLAFGRVIVNVNGWHTSSSVYKSSTGISLLERKCNYKLKRLEITIKSFARIRMANFHLDCRSKVMNDLISSMLISGTQTHAVLQLVPSVVVISLFNHLNITQG